MGLAALVAGLLGVRGDPAEVGGPPRLGAAAARRGWLGQGLVEYGLILGLSLLLALAILVFFGDVVADVVQWIGRTVDASGG